MAKKSSEIDRVSRMAQADNKKQAEVAEAEAAEAIGRRNAQKDQAVGIANEQSKQAVQTEAKTTMERTMDVKRVEQTQQAEIDKHVAIVAAEQAQRETIIKAEGEKQRLEITAQGTLTQQQLSAQGIEAEGRAKGAAEQAMLMAPVDAQIKLAEKIASLPEYQKYLVSIRQVEAAEHIGIEGAKAAQNADIKVIATGSDARGGISNALELISAKGGVNLGATLEGFLATPAGAAVAKLLGLSGSDSAPSA